MKTIWEKLNEFTGKFGNRKSSRRVNGFKTRTIDSNYHATSDDFYIGVNSEKPVTVYLPENPTDGKIIFVKAEMIPPLGNRKIIIATSDGSKIDGYSESLITVSHNSKCVIYNNNGWNII